MDPEPNSWCKFFKFNGLHIEDCFQLKKEIDRLIQEGHLKKYVKRSLGGGSRGSSSQGRDVIRIPKPSKGKELSKEDSNKTTCQTFDTITWGFVGSRKTSWARKKYACQILAIVDSPIDSKAGKWEPLKAKNTFSKKASTDFHMHNDDPIYIFVRCNNWEVKRVLSDQGSYVGILY